MLDLNAALELNGVAPRYLRLPQRTASEEEMDRIAATYEPIGLLPAKPAQATRGR